MVTSSSVLAGAPCRAVGCCAVIEPGLSGALDAVTYIVGPTVARIGHGIVRTAVDVYARASDSADREAAQLLEERFASAFVEGPSGRIESYVHL